jgi:olefin beta-lactone synthetase
VTISSANIAHTLTARATERPDHPALLCPVGHSRRRPRTYSTLTYRELDQQSTAIAHGLSAVGIGPGERTVLMVPVSTEFFVLTFALFKAGAIPVFVDPGMGIKNLGQCLAEAEPSAFIGVPKAHLARQLFGWAKRSIRHTVSVGRTYGLAQRSLAAVGKRDHQHLLSADPATTAPALGAASALTAGMTRADLAAILFTSGSTGVPKGAVYTHGNFLAQIDALRQQFQIEPGEVDLCTFPLFALFAPALGMTAVIPRMDFTRPANVDPAEIIGPIAEFSITNLFGSPALWNRVTQQPIESTSALPAWPSVRRVLSAGAPVPPRILERVTQRLPVDAEMFTPYGATEALPVAVIGSRTVLQETRSATDRGRGTCVGHPVEGLEVRVIRIHDEPIAEWSDELVLPTGEIGEIAVWGEQVTQEYFHRPDLTRLAKIEDPQRGRRWHRMGDVGYFDSHGRLWFCGRKSQRVVTPHGTLFTECLEGVFNTHPEVFRSALVGVTQQGTITPVICIERQSIGPTGVRSITQLELQQQLTEFAQLSAATAAIHTVLIYPTSFPVDIRHNSKIFREKLAVWAQRRCGARVGS